MDLCEQNIKHHLETLSGFSEEGAGVTRFPFTKEAREAVSYLMEEMKKIGLEARVDGSGSVIGRLEGKRKETIMMGSHYDTVKNGGAYDGMAGAVCAMEVARMVVESGKQPEYSLEIIATNDEEGARFKAGLFSGKVLLGQFQPEDLKGFVDADGITMYEAMEGFGLEPEKILDYKRDDIKAFLEVHIEQGPVLETAEKEIGIVSTIVGMKRAIVSVYGRPDHIGTMPMNMRKDALEVSAKVVATLGDTARKFPQTVATTGTFTIEPNIINIIPSAVHFAVDFRSVTQDIIDYQYDQMIAQLEEHTKRFGMTYSVTETLQVVPVDMAKNFQEKIEKSCVDRGYSYMSLVSGAGHDALVMGAAIDTAMIFVPSIGGRSHCPEEFSKYSDLAKAAKISKDVFDGICDEGIL